MKNLYLILPLAFVLLASAAFGAEMPKYVIGIKGMTWGVSCVKAVRGTLGKLENVDQVDVDFKGKTATVTMKKGSLTEEAVAAALKGSRYSVSSFKPVVLTPKNYIIHVTGMTWGAGCAKRVRETLVKFDGVEKVTVDFDKKTADVLMKPGTSLDEQSVAAALKKNGGYGIADFVEKIVEKKSSVVVIGVSGMTWGSCANNVREALSKLAGVEKVAVDNEKKTATLTLKEGAAISEETVAAAFRGTRYKATRFEMK